MPNFFRFQQQSSIFTEENILTLTPDLNKLLIETRTDNHKRIRCETRVFIKEICVTSKFTKNATKNYYKYHKNAQVKATGTKVQVIKKVRRN